MPMKARREMVQCCNNICAALATRRRCPNGYTVTTHCICHVTLRNNVARLGFVVVLEGGPTQGTRRCVDSRSPGPFVQG
jgi:hypothetical protein